MATVLEELLIKIGFSVDEKGLEDARDSIRDDLQSTGKETSENKKRNKSIKEQKDAIGGVNKEKKRGETDQKKTDQDDEKRVDRRKRINKELGAAKGLLGGLSKGWVAAGIAAAGYTLRMAKVNDGTAKFTRTIDISSDELQKWEFAAKKTGSSSEGLRSTLANLTGVIGAAELGQYNQGLALLGINFRDMSGEAKTSLELLEEIAGKTKDMKAGRRIAILSQIGVDPTLINLMTEARFTRDQLLREGAMGVESAEALTSAEQFQDESLKLWRAMKEDTSGIRKGVLDVGTSLLGLINEARAHRGAPVSAGPRRGFVDAITIGRAGAQSVSQNVEINVNGAQNPEATAIIIQDYLRQEIRQAGNNANKSGGQ
jgi:hypothetical protein